MRWAVVLAVTLMLGIGGGLMHREARAAPKAAPSKSGAGAT